MLQWEYGTIWKPDPGAARYDARTTISLSKWARILQHANEMQANNYDRNMT